MGGPDLEKRIMQLEELMNRTKRNYWRTIAALELERGNIDRYKQIMFETGKYFEARGNYTMAVDAYFSSAHPNESKFSDKHDMYTMIGHLLEGLAYQEGVPKMSEVITTWGEEGLNIVLAYCKEVDYHLDIGPRISSGELVGYDAQLEPCADTQHLVDAFKGVDDPEAFGFILANLPRIIQSHRSPENAYAYTSTFKPLEAVDLQHISEAYKIIREEQNEQNVGVGE